MATTMTNKVRAILSIAGKKNIDYAKILGISRQSMANKMTKGYYSANDLIKLADAVDGELIMRVQGTEITIGNDCLYDKE